MSQKIHAAQTAAKPGSSGPSRLIQRKCGCGGKAGLAGECESCRAKKLVGLQTKLAINQPGDVYEQEADRVADQVMSRSGAHAAHGAGTAPAAVAQTSAVAISRYAQGGGRGGDAPASVHDVVNSPGRPLDTGTRSFMESRFGHDFSHVRVHAGARAAESAEAIGAAAYTVGNNIAFAGGRYAPATTTGRHLLAHELTHVLQQTAVRRGGGVRAGAGGSAQPGMNVSAAPSGFLQRQDGPKFTGSGERGGVMAGPDKKVAKDKFSFKAELTLPLVDGLTFGSLSILDELKLTGSAGFLGAPLGNSPTEMDPVKLQLAMTLLKLQLERFKEKSEALKRGNLSFSTALNTSGGPTFSFDPNKTEWNLGPALTLKGAITSPSLLPSPYGTLTFGGSVSAGGSLTRTYGPDGKFTPKADSAVSLTGSYESKASRNRYLTLGGVLGDEASVTAGLDLGGTGAIVPDKITGSLSAGGSIGLSGTRKKSKTFIKLQIKSDISADLVSGKAATSTNSFFLGFTTGTSF